MRLTSPSHEIMFVQDPQEVLKQIELAGRTCYRSEDRITPESAKVFTRKILDSGHHSVIEHISITVRFICDRGITHELVRHRLASYTQESTRYANYTTDRFGREITVIKPLFWHENSKEYSVWVSAMEQAETAYMKLIKLGAPPEQARSVLPNSLGTEIVMTCNAREWRHVLSVRCSESAHPQMREIMLPLLRDLHDRLPVLFDDVYEQFKDEMAKQ